MQKICYKKDNKFSQEIQKKLCANDDVAVIGMEINMPSARGINEFWDVLSNGINCIGDYSSERKKFVIPYLNKDFNIDNFRQGAYLEKIDEFDYEYFGMTPKEANLTSPLLRMIITNVIAMLDTSGYRNKIVGSNTGLFTAAIGDIDILTYKELIKNNCITDLPLAVTGNMLSMINGRLTNLLDLKGPAEVIDTACSSALVAIHKACQAIKAQECDTAIVCSGRIHLVPSSDGCFNIGIESADGNTRTFDRNASGSGFGEGIGCVLLKSLKNAKRDGDYIYAIIKGSAVNQDGTSMGLTVPNPNAQKSVICQAWEAAGINPEELTYIECHGTATPIGDPIEINGLTAAFRKYTDKKQFCAIGSVKSNYGHLLECAGMISFIKAVLCLVKHELPPTINLACPNEEINFLESPIYLNNKLKKWKSEGDKSICGISSFGLSGVNCHIVLEDYFNNNLGYSNDADMEILTLSAQTKKVLFNNIKNLKQYLKLNSQTSLLSLTYMENIINQNFKYRVAILASSVSELEKKIEILMDDIAISDSNLDIYIGEKNCNTIVCDIPPNKNYTELQKMCLEYVNGKDYNWGLCYKNLWVQKIPIPPYEFQNTSCWIRRKEKNNKKLHENMYYTIQYRKYIDTKAKLNDSLINSALLFSDKSNIATELEKVIPKNSQFDLMTTLELHNPQQIKENFCNFLVDYQKKEIENIIFVSCSEIDENINSMKSKIKLSFYNLFLLIQTIYEQNLKNKVKVTVITGRVYDVDGSEYNLKPYNAPVVGFSRTVNTEFSNIHVRVIDIDDNISSQTLCNEIQREETEFYVAIRNDILYKEELDVVDIEREEFESIEIPEDNVILITGGLGHIGLKVAENLIKSHKEKVILVGRTSFPERDKWEELILENANPALTKKIKAIIDLDQKCGKVDIQKCDIGEEKDVCALEHYIREQYGKINIIVHAAGNTGNGLIINRNMEQITDVIKPKIYGTWLLEHFFHDAEIFISCSSGVSLIGEIGLADYAAANAYLDAFAYIRKKKNLTINWVVWEGARMMQGESKKIDGVFEELSAEVAIDCFEEILNRKVRRVMIGKLNPKVSLQSLAESSSVPISESIMGNVKDRKKRTITDRTESAICQNPMVYENVEKTLKEIVSNVLEYDNVNTYDNFFEIGGNSILLNKVWSELDEVFPNKVLISDLFIYSSINALAEFIVSNYKENSSNDDDEIDSIINSIDDCTNIDDIIQRLENI